MQIILGVVIFVLCLLYGAHRLRLWWLDRPTDLTFVDTAITAAFVITVVASQVL